MGGMRREPASRGWRDGPGPVLVRGGEPERWGAQDVQQVHLLQPGVQDIICCQWCLTAGVRSWGVVLGKVVPLVTRAVGSVARQAGRLAGLCLSALLSLHLSLYVSFYLPGS